MVLSGEKRTTTSNPAAENMAVVMQLLSVVHVISELYSKV